jgi:hypothetical protein
LFCHFQVPHEEPCNEEGKENSGDDAGAAATTLASFKKKSIGLARTFYLKMNVIAGH